VLFKLQSGLPPGDIVINAGKILTREPASLTTILGARLRGKFGTLLLSSFVGRYHKEEARRTSTGLLPSFVGRYHKEEARRTSTGLLQLSFQERVAHPI
jgi:hypothetical protein